jgi:hypothetical protein
MIDTFIILIKHLIGVTLLMHAQHQLGAILAQNPTDKFDKSVMYYSRLLNSIEKHYNNT